MSARLPILVSWSGGKDCLMALARLRTDPRWQVVALLSTINHADQRVAMHGIRLDVLRTQALALGLPLIECAIAMPADNRSYWSAFSTSLAEARRCWPALAHIAFGDLFLEDVRNWREQRLACAGWSGVYPLWGRDTIQLAESFVSDGHQAVLTCVDTTQLDKTFSGHAYDATLLAALPEGVDPCGERGEFHTLCYAGPLFAQPLPLLRGEQVLRDQRFQYTDFLLACGS